MDLKKKLQSLYSDGDDFSYGSLVYEAPDIRKLQDKAYSLLHEKYRNDVAIMNLGFNYGHASFVDILVGQTRCNSELALEEDAPFDKKCLLLLLCDYLEIYVLCEHLYTDDSHILPHFNSVDSFKSERVSSLAKEVTRILSNSGYERAYSQDLSGPLPNNIKIESNLGQETIFDGYFNWTD